MNVLIFGATGMVGQGVLRECLQAADVHRVMTVGRTDTGAQHPATPALQGGLLVPTRRDPTAPWRALEDYVGDIYDAAGVDSDG